MKCSNYRNLRCQKTNTDTNTGISRITPSKQYTLRVNWPGFKGLNGLLCSVETHRLSSDNRIFLTGKITVFLWKHEEWLKVKEYHGSIFHIWGQEQDYFDYRYDFTLHSRIENFQQNWPIMHQTQFQHDCLHLGFSTGSPWAKLQPMH